MKGLLIGILVIIVLGLGSALIKPQAPIVFTSNPGSTSVRYDSEAGKLSFLYPSSYRLEDRTDSFEGNPITVAVLLDKNAVVPDMSEGPVTISVLSVPNPKHLSLDEWVAAKSIANFGTLSNHVLTPTIVAGEPAVAYSYSGLYENDAVAVAHGERVYLFFVSWTDAQSTMRTDFQNLLKTVTFK